MVVPRPWPSAGDFDEAFHEAVGVTTIPHMPTRRSRPTRARKAQSSAPPATQVAFHPVDDRVIVSGGVDPTETDQLRALEAGWDELLSCEISLVQV
jgi:hypothetical protein